MIKIRLEDIQDPKDLKNLETEELKTLADKIREKIIEVVSENGGHLSSNLGVVELTLALHTVFESPDDRIIWDVGHQSYAHKLLTGRQDNFKTLRKLGGMSGFPKREESPHDVLETGHSSTSLSAALGMVTARDLKNEKFHVVAVIGDGALTAGLALEALNQIGHLEKNLTVVLNDNEMSISNNVGAIASYLARLRSDPAYYKLRDDIEFLIKKIPAIGERVVRAVERVKGSLKHLVIPGVFFEELGYTYLGPVDGHDLESLLSYLKRGREMDGPVMVHVITKKGKGYKPAEENPDIMHGTGPFNIETGQPIKKSSRPSYTKVFDKKICQLAAQNKKIIAITAAMPDGTGLKKFAQLYPERFFDVGIAEQHGVTFAAGMALEGYKPVFAVYSTFLQRAYDQVVHDICLSNLPCVLAIDRAGVVGEDGETHQGAFDISYLRHIPGLTLAAPRDAVDFENMLELAVNYHGPMAIRYPRGETPEIPISKRQPVRWGKGELLTDGDEVLILATGNMVWPAYEAVQILKTMDISAALVDLRFIKPLDHVLIKNMVQKTRFLITIEENVLAGGMGSAVLEFLAAEKIELPTMNIGFPDRFIPHGKADELRRELGFTPEKVSQKIYDFCLGEKRGKYEKTARYIAGGKKVFPFKK